MRFIGSTGHETFASTHWDSLCNGAGEGRVVTKQLLLPLISWGVCGALIHRTAPEAGCSHLAPPHLTHTHTCSVYTHTHTGCGLRTLRRAGHTLQERRKQENPITGRMWFHEAQTEKVSGSVITELLVILRQKDISVCCSSPYGSISKDAQGHRYCGV